VVREVERTLGRRALRFRERIGQGAIAAALRQLGPLYHRRYAERWVQLKYRIVCGSRPTQMGTEIRGLVCPDPECEACRGLPGASRRRNYRPLHPEKWPHRWLPYGFFLFLQSRFKMVSDCFDRLLFIAGKKWTSKCNLRSALPLARHNLVHYNFVFQSLHLLYDREHSTRYHRELEADYFFPLLRTEAVRKSTRISSCVPLRRIASS
jgi:hypothetical protein